MTRIQIGQSTIVGAMASWTERAPFHRAALVIAQPDGSRLKVLRYVGEGEAEGEALDRADMNALVAQGEAMTLPALPGRRHAWLWLFGCAFALDRGQAIAELSARRMVHSGPIERDGATACLILEAGAAELREVWASQAGRLCLDALHSNDTARALRCAETAYYVGTLVTPHRLALLIQAYRRAGRVNRAESYLTRSEQLYGESFADELRRELEALSPPDRWIRGRLDALRKSPLAGASRAA